MIEDVRKGDLFQSGAQTLVNTVNTVGVMGKGIALEFKRRFPEMFADYQRRCKANQSRKSIGGWYGVPGQDANPSFRAPHARRSLARVIFSAA